MMIVIKGDRDQKDALLEGKVQRRLIGLGEIGGGVGDLHDAVARASRRHLVALFHEKQLTGR